MVEHNRLRSRPPHRNGPDPHAVAAFIDGAGIPTEEARSAPTPAFSPVTPPPPYPWEAPGIREDVHKVYNLRLPEPYLLKLKYIADHSPESMQQFCLNTVLPAIDDRIAALTGTPDRAAQRR